MRRPPFRLVQILAPLLFLPLSIVAQEPPPGVPQPGQPFLLPLGHPPILVRYSPGALDRAAHFQQRLELMLRDYKKWSDYAPPALEGLVLLRDDWERLYPRSVYGLPRSDGARVAVPAWGDPQTVRLWEGLLGGALPPLAGVPLFGSPEEAVSVSLADRLGAVELGVVLARGAGFRTAEPWVERLLGHLVVVAGGKHSEPPLGDLVAFYLRAESAQGGDRAHPLSAYAPTLPPGERLWYDASLFTGALAVVEAEGKKPLQALSKLQNKLGRPLAGADLFARYPELAAWKQASFAPEGR